MKTWMFTAAVLVACAVPALAQEQDKDASPLARDEQLRIIEKLKPGFVGIEYQLQYSKGRVPTGADISYLCHNCGSYHTRQVGEQLIKERRPLEEAGFVLDNETVITRDITIPPEFIGGILVRQGDRSVAAEVAGYFLDNNAMLLKLKGKLEGARSLDFKKPAGQKLLGVTGAQYDGRWMLSVKPLPETVCVGEGKDRMVLVPVPCLVIDEKHEPVGLAMNSVLPADDSWQGSPLQWRKITAVELADRLKKLEQLADDALLRVTINFRSVAAKPGAMDSFHFRTGRRESGDSETEANAVGICIGKRRLLALVNLEPENTARLEKIRIFDKNGNAIEGKFVANLRDFGAMLVATDKDLPGVIELKDINPDSIKYKLLLKADVTVAGEQRIADYWDCRLTAFEQGKDNRLQPVIGGREEKSFIFTTDLDLLTMPVVLKDRLASGHERRYRRPSPQVVMCSYLKSGLAHEDASNMPLDEQKEKRIAWLGFTLQKMTPELARANKCSRETRNGEIGAVVAKVYPGSPAEKAGIQPGMILLRLELENETKPLDVLIDDSEDYMRGIPWDRMGDVPPQYLENIPPPWHSVNNNFTRMLTDLGFGTKFKAYFLNKGAEMSSDFNVVESPPHFNSAARIKSEALGITVRDMTFEVRDFLQKKQDDPGVVVSKIETGGRAAVGGIRPYEVITHVNGQPIKDAAAFEKMVAGQQMLNFSVSRMAESRQVSINMADPVPPPAAKDNLGIPETDE